MKFYHALAGQIDEVEDISATTDDAFGGVGVVTPWIDDEEGSTRDIAADQDLSELGGVQSWGDDEVEMEEDEVEADQDGEEEEAATVENEQVEDEEVEDEKIEDEEAEDEEAEDEESKDLDVEECMMGGAKEQGAAKDQEDKGRRKDV